MSTSPQFILSILTEIDNRAEHVVYSYERDYLDQTYSLDLSAYDLDQIPESIRELRNLNTLILEHNHLQSLPESIGELKNLIFLDLRNNFLHDLPDSIGNLKRLSRVYLYNNLFRFVPKCILDLSNLTELDLDENVLQNLPEEMNRLTNLEFLDLKNNELVKLPESLGELSSLDSLYLGNNPLESLPDSLIDLQNLTTLNLAGLKLSSLPLNMARMTKLKKLDIRGMKMEYLPKELVDMQLDFYPKAVDYLSADSGICIEKVVLTLQPLDMFRQNDRILIEDWYKNHHIGNTVSINEAKVVFLGDGDVGKTYSIKRLMRDGERETNTNADYFQTTMTHGIIIENKEEKLKDGRKLSLRYWDFGGQTIMHSMHRCFLTDHTCYVIVISTRNDRDQMTQARYWLRNVQSFARYAPVILMINQWGEMVDRLDRGRLFEEFDNLKNVVMINVKEADKRDFLEIRDAILQEVQEMSSCSEQWPVSWHNVRNRITRLAEKNKQFLISEVDYEKICTDYGITEAKLKTAVLDRFNWLGVCFSYHQDQNKKLLAQYKVLNPEWLTNAIYLIIIKGQRYAVKGILTFEAVKDILKHPEEGESGKVEYMKDVVYSEEECRYVLEIMRKFGLSYETKEGEFIPVLCTEKRPSNLVPEEWKQSRSNSNRLTYILRYEYKPDTIIQRLMVYCKRADIPVEAWQNGMRASYGMFGLTIVVDAGRNEQDLVFDVYSTEVEGEKVEMHLLLQMLLKQLDIINDELNMEPEAYIEVRGKDVVECFKMKLLVNMAKKGRKFVDGEEGDEYEIEPLLQNIYGRTALTKAKIYTEKQKIDLDLKMLQKLAFDNDIFQEQTRELNRQIDEFCQESPYTEEGLCEQLSLALIKVQRNHKLYGRLENDLNTALRDLLPDQFYEKRDQTLAGRGVGGGAAGELDLELYHKVTSKPVALIEALRLNSLERSEIQRHVDKTLRNYNPSGVPYTFLIMYCETEHFDNLWEKIVDYMGRYEFQAPIRVVLNEDGEVTTVLKEEYANIGHAKIELILNGKIFPLHIYAIQIHSDEKKKNGK